MKVRNKHSTIKRKVVSTRRKPLSGKFRARRKEVRNSRSPRIRRTSKTHSRRVPERLSQNRRTDFQIEDTSINSQRSKSQNEEESNSAKQQDCTPVNLKKIKNKRKLRASFNRHRKLIEEATAESSRPVTSASRRLLRRSLRLSMSTLQKTTPADSKSIGNLSDCVLIEEVPEIIVIDDEDDDNDENKISTEANELLDQVFEASESMNDCTITEDMVKAESKNLSRISLESGELSPSIIADDTILEVDKHNENINDDKSEGDNLSMFYEDITASFTAQNDVPEYERIYSEKSSTVQNRSVLSDDVEYVSSGVLTRKERKKRKKKMQMQSQDDSVIFVSEETVPKNSQIINTLEFIPLDNGNYQNSDAKKTPEAPIKRSRNPDSFLERITQPFKKLKENLGLSYYLGTETPPGKILHNDISFTTTERKRNAIYNSNTYNPNKEEKGPGKRMVIIDGSNVAYAHSCNKEFSVKGIEIALQYFEKMGHEAKAVVPQHRLQKARSSDPDLLESLHRDGKIVLTPCKNLPGKSTSCYDDRFILQLAVEFDAAVVSNDNYRDLLNENPAFKKVIETRVIGYTWCKDMFMLPKDPYGRSGPALSVILNRT